MIRNTSTIIILTLLLSACCEKEGSFLNTIIKNNTAKIMVDTQQETIVSQESSMLNANATTFPVESTLTSSPKSNKENSGIKKPEAITIEKTVTKVAESFENLNQPQTIAKLETSDIDTRSQDQLPIKNESIEIKAEDAKLTTNINQGISIIKTEEVIEKIVDQSRSLNDEKNNDNQNVITAMERAEHSLDNEHNKTKTPTDNKKKKLSQSTSLLNEKDNTATEYIVEQTKAEKLVSDVESKFDQNKKLLEILSKDITQQVEKPNPKISKQSLQLLDDILSD